MPRAPQAELLAAARAIARRDPAVTAQLRASPSLLREVFRMGATRADAVDWYFKDIEHYVYGGDTLLHVAAAAYDRSIARVLCASGADVAGRNRRGAEPLHYACDGSPNAATWDPWAQAAIVSFLI